MVKIKFIYFIIVVGIQGILPFLYIWIHLLFLYFWFIWTQSRWTFVLTYYAPFLCPQYNSIIFLIFSLVSRVSFFIYHVIVLQNLIIFWFWYVSCIFNDLLTIKPTWIIEVAFGWQLGSGFIFRKMRNILRLVWFMS
jgi:hypothetical protein